MNNHYKNAALVFFVLAMSTGCTQKDIRQSVINEERQRAQQECVSAPPGEFSDCLNTANKKSYELRTRN